MSDGGAGAATFRRGGHKNFVIEEVQKVWKTLSYAFIIIIADPLDTDRILLNKYL